MHRAGNPAERCDTSAMPRFLTLADVADVLNVSAAQAYALVRSGDIRAIKVGGRGQWRIEETELEDYIRRMYAETAAFVADPACASDVPEFSPGASPGVSPEISVGSSR